MSNGNTEKVLEFMKFIFERLGAILRYIAPGFIAILVFAILSPETLISKNKSTLTYPYWIIIIGAALSGIWIYALHICVIVRISWLPIIIKILKHTECSYFNKKKFKEKQKQFSEIQEDIGVFRVQTIIDGERWKRRGSNMHVQRELDKWGAMQSFLYCSAYIMILMPLLMKWVLGLICSISVKEFFILFLGAITFVGAIVSEYRHTNREFWALNNIKTDTNEV